MIPRAFITEWGNQVPWQTNEQVEQDLVICRALVEIFSDEWLASRLAFRGERPYISCIYSLSPDILKILIWFKSSRSR